MYLIKLVINILCIFDKQYGPSYAVCIREGYLLYM